MRSRSTNFLQVVVLLTGAVYIVIGLFFYVSPLTVLKLFAENVSENWIDLVKDHELVGPLYYIARGFAALVFSSGVAMIMPLFDPLKYRGLIYFNGLVFPFLASILMIKNGIYFIFLKKQPGAETAGVPVQHGHLILLVLGIIFTVIFIFTLAGLIATKKQAKEGLE